MSGGRSISSSLEDARTLGAKLASGELGASLQSVFEGQVLALESACGISSSATKEALADDMAVESEDDARKRRLAELLRRREPSGLATGSATPTPPRDNA